MKVRVIMFLLLMFNVIANAQSYDKKELFAELGTWSYKMPERGISFNSDVFGISSFVTRQKILSYNDFEIKQKTLTELPKYRYEVVLTSKSTKKNEYVSTILYSMRVFINGVEVSKEQFPQGLTVVIKAQPTPIYWYETGDDKIDVKITWEGCDYFEGK
jgi:hypothetical protein